MVRNVFVKIRKDQQQFEHTVTLIRIRCSCAVFEVLDDRECIREQPFQIVRIELFAPVSTFESFICAEKSFVEKMVQAKLFAREPLRKRFRTPGPAASYMDGGSHDSPRDLESSFLRGACRETSTINCLRALMRRNTQYPSCVGYFARGVNSKRARAGATPRRPTLLNSFIVC
jgi:hypothetical protein